MPFSRSKLCICICICGVARRVALANARDVKHSMIESNVDNAVLSRNSS